jgi:hypothetical protein
VLFLSSAAEGPCALADVAVVLKQGRLGFLHHMRKMNTDVKRKISSQY